MFADSKLARRLERAEGLACAAFVEARAKARPSSGACWEEIAGVPCMFDGPESPATQTFELGMNAPVTVEGLQRMEAFFHSRGAPVFHEVSPLADPSAMELLNARGYRPFEFTTVLARDLEKTEASPKLRCPVREARPAEAEHWAKLAAEGWNQPELALFFEDYGAVLSRKKNAYFFYAEVEGALAATGCLNLHEGVALLAGASTVPDARGQGAQQSLLAYRLAFAARLGCSLAVMGALPGSASQRNAQRNGFEVAYTRLKWRLPV